MMKTIPVLHPLPLRHVWSLLTLTCHLHANGTGSSTYPPKFVIYSNEHKTCVAYSHIHTQTQMEQKLIKPHGKNFRSEFLQVLSSRRTNQVPLTIELAKPVPDPPTYGEEVEMVEIMQCLLNHEIEEGAFKEENLYLTVEEGEQGRLPLLILSLKESDDQHRKRPALVLLHGTTNCKENLRPLLQAYASRGYVAIAVDSRYHGERASSKNAYQDALIDAWKNGKTMPFIYDTVWDLIKLADYLTQRRDVDPSRIGITGISLGGMHAWFAAAVDTRYAVVASVIGVQGFRWAIDNNKWQPRVESLKPVFEVARHDLGKSVIDREVVEKVWDRIAPGLASQFDSPNSIASIAPRPLLILNGAEDPRCPLGGLEVPVSNALQTYGELDCLDNFKFIAEPGVGHQLTRFQMKEAAAWFDTFLKP